EAVGDVLARERVAVAVERHRHVEDEDARERGRGDARVPVPADVVELHRTGTAGSPHTEADVAGGGRDGDVHGELAAGPLPLLVATSLSGGGRRSGRTVLRRPAQPFTAFSGSTTARMARRIESCGCAPRPPDTARVSQRGGHSCGEGCWKACSRLWPCWARGA